MSIPFNKPTFVGKENEYIQQALQNDHISGDGPFTKKSHALLEEALGVPKVLLTTSCTHALEMSALLLDLKEGDEVIVPSFTFVSTINAFVLRGATPVFADIRPDTLNLDESRLESLITPRTRAIVVVHYAGVGCEMDAIMEIANRHQLPVVEDNAHGLFGKYKGKYLGTFGALATQSFHETKNFTSGEGGALLINDEQLIEPAEILREKGTNRSRFFRGQVDKYTWVSVGSSYLPSDMLAAFLIGAIGRTPANPILPPADLGNVLQGIGSLGGREQCAVAFCSRALRADLSHVLSALPEPGNTAGCHRSFERTQYPCCFPLPAITPLSHGRKLWRQGW